MHTTTAPTNRAQRRAAARRNRRARLAERASTVLRDESGISLVQTMAGIIVGAIFVAGGTLAATQIIPMRVEMQAEQRLEDIANAERSAITADGSYVDYQQLHVGQVYDSVSVRTGNGGNCYTAVSRANTGAVFLLESPTADELGIQELTDGYLMRCLTPAEGREMLVEAGATTSEAIRMISGTVRAAVPTDVRYEPDEGRLTFVSANGVANQRIEVLGSDRSTWTTLPVQMTRGESVGESRYSFSTTIPAEHRSSSLRVVSLRSTTRPELDSWPAMVRAIDNPAGLLARFEEGIGTVDGRDWEAQDGELKWIPASHVGGVEVTAPGKNRNGSTTNTSIGALTLREGLSARSPLVDISSGSRQWAMRFDGRLSGQAWIGLEFYDAKGKLISSSGLQPIRSSGGNWVMDEDARPFLFTHKEDLPASATQIRVVLKGSGNTRANAAQFDNIQLFDLQADTQLAKDARQALGRD